MNTYLLVCLLFILLFFSAFFSCSETALMSINRLRLFHLVHKGDKRAKKVNRILSNQHAMLGTILVGNNFVNVSASVIASLLGIMLVGQEGLLYVTILMTFILLIFCEITPKMYATSHAEQIASKVAWLIETAMYVLRPIVWLVVRISDLLLGILGQKRLSASKRLLTNEEIKSVITLGEQVGALAQNERKMLQSILELTNTTVKDVMVPRTDMVGLNIGATKDEVIQTIMKTGFSRFPVFQDTIDNIVGVIHSKDLIWETGTGFSLAAIMKRPFFVPESMKIHRLLGEFKKGWIHLAIVVDEYGGVEGMVTLEDLLEEIVGEIRDEFDVTSGPPFQTLPDGAILVNGNITLRDLRRHLNLDLGDEENKSLAGLIMEELGHIPKPGESLEYKGYHISVNAMRRQKIAQVKISLPH
ncbi:MAG: HlyC/CorC family transporter [bacterium]